jgi:hypothetical protein
MDSDVHGEKQVWRDVPHRLTRIANPSSCTDGGDVPSPFNIAADMDH